MVCRSELQLDLFETGFDREERCLLNKLKSEEIQKLENEPVSLKLSELVKNSIIFAVSNDDWVMKITNSKISFNRDRWPDASPDDFAKAVIAILEGATVNMENLKKQFPFYTDVSIG